MTRDDLEPSDLLAALAERIYRWEEAGGISETWLDDVDRAMTPPLAADVRAAAEIEVVMANATQALAAVRTDRPTFDQFLEVVKCLQRLDDWHSPLLLGAGALTELTDRQELALQRLVVDGGGYNAPGTLGSVIPAAASGLGRPAMMLAGTVAQLLHSTAYLPPAVAAGGPDDPSVPSSRTVVLRYVATSSRSGDPRGEVGDAPRISVAPVVQRVEDATVELRSDPERYGVRVLYDVGRLDEIVAAAVAADAHLLMMPEMVVDARHRRELASAIRRAVAAHRRSTGRQPELRFVIAGLTHLDGSVGNNSIVVMNAEGRSILEQDKLCRWNLKWYHQLNYGVRPSCTDGTPDLKEDIPGGNEVWIADLATVGRFLTLICADMDYDKPGDWLVRNVAVDWLHAPVMDKSIALHFDGSGALQPWIVARARRAANNGVPRIVVTNSVLLTLKINELSMTPASAFPVFETCTIAFMLDASGVSQSYREIDVAVPCTSSAPIVATVTWPDGFAPFPPPPPPPTK